MQSVVLADRCGVGGSIFFYGIGKLQILDQGSLTRKRRRCQRKPFLQGVVPSIVIFFIIRRLSLSRGTTLW
jgi:hypothetical protein